jgi:hypothetical protein
MYTSPFDECNLFNENQASQYSTESIAHQLRHNLGEAMRQTYRPEISNIEGVRLLWNQDHRGLVEIRLCAAQGRWHYYDYFAHVLTREAFGRSSSGRTAACSGTTLQECPTRAG